MPTTPLQVPKNSIKSSIINSDKNQSRSIYNHQQIQSTHNLTNDNLLQSSNTPSMQTPPNNPLGGMNPRIENHNNLNN
jgi:hypothetical protein